MTAAERTLWRHLKVLPIEGTHFRRQAPMGPYFADFACHELRLVIEVDGGQHNQVDAAASDSERTAYLASQGYRVLRYWNSDVLGNIGGVMQDICAAVAARANAPTPDPSPPQAGGGERRGTA